MSGAAKINEELITWIDMTGVTFFSQIEYLLIRLFLIALLLIGAYKLLEREVYGASASTELQAALVVHSYENRR
jgi:hypothetical protein